MGKRSQRKQPRFHSLGAIFPQQSSRHPLDGGRRHGICNPQHHPQLPEEPRTHCRRKGWASHRSGAQGCPGRITGPVSGHSFARGGIGVHTPPPARRMLGRLRLRQGPAQVRPSTANTADRPVHRGQPQELQAHPQSTADRPYGPGGSRVLQPGTGSPPGRTGPPRTGPSAGRVAARLVRTTGFSSPGGKPRRSGAHRPGYRRCRQEPQGGGVHGQHADGGLPLPAVQGAAAHASQDIP